MGLCPFCGAAVLTAPRAVGWLWTDLPYLAGRQGIALCGCCAGHQCRPILPSAPALLVQPGTARAEGGSLGLPKPPAARQCFAPVRVSDAVLEAAPVSVAVAAQQSLAQVERQVLRPAYQMFPVASLCFRCVETRLFAVC